jgi:glutamyl/glutaminyl-tRNA synthetase
MLSREDFLTRGNFSTPDETMLGKAVPLLKERAQTFGEAREMLKGELACLFVTPALEADLLRAKEEGQEMLAKTALQSLLGLIEALPEGVSANVVKDTLMPLADAEEARGKGGRGAVLWPLRYALSGQERSPDPFTLIAILGRDASLARIHQAIAILSE